MTNLSLNNPLQFAPSENAGRIIDNPFLNFFGAFVSTNATADKNTNFIDAWLLSCNGQG